MFNIWHDTWSYTIVQRKSFKMITAPYRVINMLSGTFSDSRLFRTLGRLLVNWVGFMGNRVGFSVNQVDFSGNWALHCLHHRNKEIFSKPNHLIVEQTRLLGKPGRLFGKPGRFLRNWIDFSEDWRRLFGKPGRLFRKPGKLFRPCRLLKWLA